MSETRWTPGPWLAKLGEFDFTNDGGRSIMTDVPGAPYNEDYKRIALVDSQIERKRGKNATPYNAPDDERDANAKLIAASPELYRALYRLLAICEDELDESRVPEMKEARAALAKARGE